ncbi:MAG: serine/threonine-protein kinase [Planctomycetes bacterium]|nr:serine/threonine-protein kinase [Planctomycetota bacterium]
MSGADSDAGSPDDDLLDRLLTDFIDAVSEGRAVDLDAAVPGRPDLRDRVRAAWALAIDIAPRRPALRPTFAGYEILRELGRGGMGQVLLARHTRLGRTVALKVLPRRMAAGRARERFDREARAVARLQHPLVVPVYDLGEAEGQPYFTMAFVEGATLATAIQSVRSRDPQALTGADFGQCAGVAPPPQRWAGPWWRAAAQSAADVADALSYAHSQGVTHRDVKPSNVMLRRDGFALLFDFGLASVDDEATLTLTHSFVGTPHYASPEQAAGATDSIDVRTDVFSLGATLYEAITLALPFPGPTTHEVLRRIQTWEPESPSKLNASIPKDLETVVLAALEKDPAKRYASAAAFAEDLRAVLDGRKVRAKRAGFIERGLRSVKRGRALTDLLVEQQAHNAELRSAVLRAERNEAEAREARARAEAERDKAAAVTSLLVDTLGSADPEMGGRDVRVADVLRKAAERARRDFADHPELRAAVLLVVSKTFTGLGASEEAVQVAEEALVRARADLGPDRIETIHLLGVAASAAGQFGEFDRALAFAQEAADSAARAFGHEHPVTVEASANLGGILTAADRPIEAEAVLRPALADAVRALGPSAESTLHAQNNLALALANSGRSDEADVLMHATWVGRRDTVGERHPDTLNSLGLAAQLRKEAGRVAESRPMFERAVELSMDVFGERHPTTVMNLHNLAGAAMDAGDFPEALRCQERALRAAPGALAADSGPMAAVILQLARIRAGLLDHGGAAEAALRARAILAGLGLTEAAERASRVADDAAAALSERGASPPSG